MAYICRKSKRAVLTLDSKREILERLTKGKEIEETVTLPDCTDDVEDDNGVTDAPPVPSHSKAYGLIN